VPVDRHFKKFIEFIPPILPLRVFLIYFDEGAEFKRAIELSLPIIAQKIKFV